MRPVQHRRTRSTSTSRAVGGSRAAHPALADGAQVHRYAADGAGIFAVSRIGAAPRAATTREGSSTSSRRTTAHEATAGDVRHVDDDRCVHARVRHRPGRQGQGRRRLHRHRAAALRERVAGQQADLDHRARPRRWRRCCPRAGRTAAPRSAPTSRRAPSRRRRSCGARSVPAAWQPLGTDDNAPFRVFHDVSGIPLATPIEYRAVVEDAAGRVAGDSTTTQVVKRPTQTVPELGDPPAEPAGQRRDRRHPEQRDGLPGRLGALVRPGAR